MLLVCSLCTGLLTGKERVLGTKAALQTPLDKELWYCPEQAPALAHMRFSNAREAGRRVRELVCIVGSLWEGCTIRQKG